MMDRQCGEMRFDQVKSWHGIGCVASSLKGREVKGDQETFIKERERRR